MKRILMALVALAMILPLAVGGQTTSMPISYTWTAPTTGSAVHHYEIQVSASTPILWVSQTPTTTTNGATITLPTGSAWIVRVRGVDAQGRSGLWSEASEPCIPDAGPPGACGKPVRVP